MQVVLERGNEEEKGGVEEEERRNEMGGEEELKDLEKGEVKIDQESVQIHPPTEFHMSRMQRLSTTNPLRLVINNATRVASPSPSQLPPRPSPSPLQQQPQPRSIPTPQVNNRKNKIFYVSICLYGEVYFLVLEL